MTCLYFRAGLSEHRYQHFPCVGIVVDNHYSQSIEPDGGRGRPARGIAGAAVHLERLLMNCINRKRDCKGSALAFARAIGLDCTSVQLNQMLHNSEPETKAAIFAIGRSLCLAEAVKHIWQELPVDSYAGIADGELKVLIPALHGDIDGTGSRCELHGV